MSMLFIIGVVPCIHFLITDGLSSLIYDTGVHWLVLMAILYIGGALLYALRVPERFSPGNFDIWVST